MKYKQYKLEQWCKDAKIKMIEDDLTIADVIKGTGLTRAYVISTLNGKTKYRTARSKISDFLGISNYYSDD